MSSIFVAIEGPNGVGKSTVARILADQLAARSPRGVHLTSEPTRTALGQLLRHSEAVLHGRALALALAADRAAHLDYEIIPALDDGRHVVTDRYVPSSLVLQRLDGLDLREIWSCNRYALPAITIYLQDRPDVIAARLAQGTERSRLEDAGSPDRELQLYREATEFLRRQDWPQHVVDCHGCTPEQVAASILDLLSPHLTEGT